MDQLAHGGEGLNLEFQGIETKAINKNLNQKITKQFRIDNKNLEMNKLDCLVTNDVYNLIANDIPKKRKCSLELRASKKRKKSVVETRITKKNKGRSETERPTTVTLANVMGGKKNRNVSHEGLRVLLDTGCSDSLLHTKYCRTKKITKSENTYSTGGGELTTQNEGEAHFTLTEFSDKKIIDHKFNLFESTDIGYDMVLGRDLMYKLGMDISFENKHISWEGIIIPMRDYNKLRKYKMSKLELKAFISESAEPVVTEKATKRIIKILDANYQKADLRLVVQQATHLNPRQKEMLYALLLKYKKIFSGELGEWRTDPVDLELKEGSEPHCQRHYPVPRIHREVFKKDLDRLESLGVLEKTNDSEWGSPSFIIPKKNGTVRFISDFRRLNQKIKRKPYPLPRISDTLQ